MTAPSGDEGGRKTAVVLEIKTMTERLALEAALDCIIYSDVAEQDISHAARNLKDRLQETLLLRKIEAAHDPFP